MRKLKLKTLSLSALAMGGSLLPLTTVSARLNSQPEATENSTANAHRYQKQIFEYYKRFKFVLDQLTNRIKTLYTDAEFISLLNEVDAEVTKQISAIDQNKENLDYLSQNLSSLISDFNTLNTILSSLQQFHVIVSDRNDNSFETKAKQDLYSQAKIAKDKQGAKRTYENNLAIIQSAIAQVLKQTVSDYKTASSSTTPATTSSLNENLKSHYTTLKNGVEGVKTLLAEVKSSGIKVDLIEKVLTNSETRLNATKTELFEEGNEDNLKADINVSKALEEMLYTMEDAAVAYSMAVIIKPFVDELSKDAELLNSFYTDLDASTEVQDIYKFSDALFKMMSKRNQQSGTQTSSDSVAEKVAEIQKMLKDSILAKDATIQRLEQELAQAREQLQASNSNKTQDKPSSTLETSKNTTINQISIILLILAVITSIVTLALLIHVLSKKTKDKKNN
ncbi:hypothetical protein [Mycoplasma simbae]|uniref:hypothetical protein n=1 Tax=Mycoplasma simbae TaxID=36744 RepID=UPI000496C012|nr:hypothetical protein [Mycoplasma simbae]